MNIEKSREQFVIWIESLNVGYDTRFFEGILGGGFNDAEVEGLWTTWQASRAAIEVKTPEDFTDGGSPKARILIAHHREIVARWINAIESTGMKVKP